MLVSSSVLVSKSYASDSLLIREPWKGDLEQMLERGVIRLLTVHNPMLYFLDGPIQRGVTYELAKQFEETINTKYKTRWDNRVSVVIVAVRRDQLIPALISGFGDIAAANLTVTPERQKLVDFSDVYLDRVEEQVITNSKVIELSTLEDLAGITLHVRGSSSYYNSLKKINNKSIQIKLANELLEDYDLLEMVNANLISATVVDSHKAAFWVEVLPNIKINKNIPINQGGKIAWAFRKNSPTLQQEINEFVSKHKKGTLLGNIIGKRYLQNNKWAKNALTQKERKKFESLVSLFKTYGDQYNFDSLLIAAQGYQESQLDHSKRSPSGAIGVMQVLPTTAADKNVNIKNIEVLENNIHAGTKYLSFIRERYFSDAAMDDFNQTLFSFAAYNAGPAKITKLRKEAEQLNLDPNVWFQNVEVVAAQRIGRETVQYVRNIFKYYVAYKTIFRKIDKKQKIKQEASN